MKIALNCRKNLGVVEVRLQVQALSGHGAGREDARAGHARSEPLEEILVTVLGVDSTIEYVSKRYK